MIPEKLQLRNFMCYGEDVPPLQFAGLHVACLSGQNGAGKSALLDALTWSLWGKARAKSDDDLITLGREEMEVALEFLLDNQIYRVIRRRKRGKRAGSTTLDFQIRERDTTWRRLSGDTIAETQAAINRVLRIEYDTFINSAFLIQGRADEFTGRKPAERKQVLADILGLSEYEELERRAKDAINERTKDLDLVQSHIMRLQAEAEQQPVLEQQRDEAQERVAAIQEELHDHEAGTQELREQASRLREASARRDALAQSLAQGEQAQRELYGGIARLQNEIAVFEAVIARRDAIEQGCEHLHAAQAALEEMDRRREEAYRLKEEFNQWQRQLDALRHQLELEQRSAQEQLARLDAQLARRSTALADREGLTRQLVELSALQATLAQLKADESRLIEQQAMLLELQVRAKELQGIVNVQRDSLIGVQQEQQRREAELSEQAAALPDLDRALREVRSELAAFQAREDELVTRRDDLAAALQRQGELQSDYKAVEAEGKEIGNKLQLIEQGEGTCPVCDSALGNAGLVRIVEQYHERRDALRQQIVDLRRETRENDALVAEQRAAIEQLEQFLALRSQAEARRAKLELQQAQATEARAKLADVRETLRTVEVQLEQRAYAQAEQRELDNLEAQLALLGDLTTIKRQLAQLRAEVATTERQIAEASQIQQQVALLDAELAAIAEAEAQRPAVLARHESICDQLEHEAYGEEERRAREAVRAEGQALGYSKEAHAVLRSEVDELKRWEREALDLERALASVERSREYLRRDEEQCARVAADLAEKRQQIALLNQQLHDQARIELALRDADTHSRMLQTQLQIAQRALGSAEELLRVCQKSALLLVEQRAHASVLADERAVYDELAQAFGKKGVQAMLIETAIPELEQEANKLLSRMTDNQFHLAFETQRDTKKGDSTIETLDIRISDSLGTRDYQMYSGGEAFRVNFAIRIALSKLLARRAGANLKTLIIDEGFGTQDGKGRDRVVEAINAIADDFDCILVITHIQELKDMFPTQIEITKTAHGSTWSVS
ncbi:MAG TPA: SMC family ATPase [Herpetosiphonaceae bacterium]